MIYHSGKGTLPTLRRLDTLRNFMKTSFIACSFWPMKTVGSPREMPILRNVRAREVWRQLHENFVNERKFTHSKRPTMSWGARPRRIVVMYDVGTKTFGWTLIT